MYTVPPLAVCCVNLTAMTLMACVFRERYAGLANPKVGAVKLGDL